MTREQQDFLNNLTDSRAQAVLAKFRNDPGIAADAGEAAYAAFNRAWEHLNPTEYWQRHSYAGGVNYNLISLD